MELWLDFHYILNPPRISTNKKKQSWFVDTPTAHFPTGQMRLHGSYNIGKQSNKVSRDLSKVFNCKAYQRGIYEKNNK